jgi:aryl carrier-like protein
MNKTLIFEGAGWAGADTSKGTDVTNCRIRTRLRNNIGRIIYLEMGCCYFDEKTKIVPNYAEGLKYATHIDSVHFDDAKWDKKRCHSRSLSSLAKTYFEYNKDNILKFVNEKLDCSFDSMEVINEGLHIFDNEEPVCSSTDKEFEPFRDIEVNINALDSIKPIIKWDRYREAEYRISYNSLMQIPYMKRYAEERAEQNCKDFLKDGKYKAVFRWDENGIITSLELHAGCCMGVSAEDVQNIVNLIITDNKQVMAA